MKHTSLALILFSTMLTSVSTYADDSALQVPDSLGKVAELGDKAAEKAADAAKEIKKSAELDALPDLSTLPPLPGEETKSEKAPTEENKADSLSVPPPVALPVPATVEKKDEPAKAAQPAENPAVHAEKKADTLTTPPPVALPAPATSATGTAEKKEEPVKAAEPAEKPPALSESPKTEEPAKHAEAPSSSALPAMTLPPAGSFPKMPAPASFALPSLDGSPVIPTEEETPAPEHAAITPVHAQPVNAAPNTAIKTPEPSRKAAYKKITKPVDMAKRYKNRLPDTIYATKYPKGNKHLPYARYERDLDAQIFVSIRKDNINGLRALLDYSKRSVNKPDRYGDTPLIAAVKANAVNSARLLIGRKADLNAVDAQGLTALDNAKRLGLYRIARALTIMSTESGKVAANTVAAPAPVNAFSPLELTQ